MSGLPTTPTPYPRRRTWLVAGAVIILVAATLTAEIITTRPVRQALTAYTALLNAANLQDIATLRQLCSARYLNTHALRPAREGGVVGLPRNIHKNFRAWRHGPYVWLCPTNRVGPLYQFVLEAGSWRFDGPIGILRARGEVVPYSDLSDVEDTTPGGEVVAESPESPR